MAGQRGTGQRGTRLRFVGEICGFGTQSGTRVVIGYWPQSPFGPVADAMVEQADGRRLLIAPTDQLAELIGSLYAFDDCVVAPVEVMRGNASLEFRGGPMHARLTIGTRDALGWALRSVPGPIARSPRWASAIDPLARVVMRGVRTAGQTPGGREYYGAMDRHRITSAVTLWSDQDLGPLADVDPPVRFGFSSTPRRPSIVRVHTTIAPAIS